MLMSTHYYVVLRKEKCRHVLSLFTMGKQAGKWFDRNGMTDIHGGLPLGAGSETGEGGAIRWDHSQMISEINECNI